MDSRHYQTLHLSVGKDLPWQIECLLTSAVVMKNDGEELQRGLITGAAIEGNCAVAFSIHIRNIY